MERVRDIPLGSLVAAFIEENISVVVVPASTPMIVTTPARN
jgi:hypothetical protein